MAGSDKPDFNLILASSVHDMKNSLNLVLNSLEDINREIIERQPELAGKVGLLQYEATRVNNDLVRLLTLYKIDQELMGVRIDEHSVHDLLSECQARFQPLLEARGIRGEMQCDPDLMAYFDVDLITGTLENILANAIRYSRQRVCLRAETYGSGIRIQLEDDGEGFPPVMLEAGDQNHASSDFQSGSTHLGLYFARVVAALHRQGARQGEIRLSNDSQLGGARFQLILP